MTDGQTLKETSADVIEDARNSAAHEEEGAEAARQTARDAAREAANLPEEVTNLADPEASRRSYLLRRYWYSARGFWGKSGDRLAWLLSAGVVTLILLALAAQYGVNLWNRITFDALEKKDAGTVLLYAGLFVPLAIASVSFSVANVYVRMTIQRRWRAWLNNHVVDRWLQHGRYYQLNLVAGDHDNPEYRIAQDLRVASDAPVDFTVGVISAALSAATFITVLWTIGGSLSFEIGGFAATIPGFLVIAAIVYSGLASGLMALIGRRFVAVSENVNQTEADYRYELTRVRENGESIALMDGEQEERSGLDRSLKKVLRGWRELCGQHMRTTIVSQGSWLVAPVIPVILCAPKFLDGTMSLGTVMQAASAFTIVQAAFGWLVDNYPRLADWSASARRIASLMVSLDALERAETGDGIGRINREAKGSAVDDVAIHLRDLSVTLDDGTAVIGDAEVAIKQGERVLVAGESGTGKSVLVRAIAGLWPWGEGSIEIRAGANLFMLPQRPYVPTGTLRRAAAYPSAAEHWTLDEIAEAFENCGLEHLTGRLEEAAPWDQTLSGGEKQRLAFVRLFLHRPDIVVFDEATSALDPSSQDTLMGLVCTVLKDATLISVGHRPELEAFHSRKIVLERRLGAAHFVSDVLLISPPGRERLLRRWLRRRKSKKPAAGGRVTS